MPHVCNLYCDGEVHALRLLRSRPNDEAQIRRDYAVLGVNVVRIRPVLEFDLADWQRYMQIRLCTTDAMPHVRHDITLADVTQSRAIYAYLLFARWHTGKETP